MSNKSQNLIHHFLAVEPHAHLFTWQRAHLQVSWTFPLRNEWQARTVYLLCVTMRTNFFFCRKCGPISRRAGQHLPPFTSLYFLTRTLLEMVEWRRKENQGLTGTGCCQKDRLYWNRCFENLWKPAERCQNVHNMNQQFTDILCEFGLVAEKFRRNPRQKVSAVGTASPLNRHSLVCSVTACVMLSCRREDKGGKKKVSSCYIYILHYLGIVKSGKKTW